MSSLEHAELLKVVPYEIDALDLLPMRRSRLHWLSWTLAENDELLIDEGIDRKKVRIQAEWPEFEHFLEKGASKMNEMEGFPTFVRAIRRSKPPHNPSALDELCDKERELWEADGYRFPPYQYAVDSLIRDAQQKLRPPISTERERLMGFHTDYTLPCLQGNARKNGKVRLLEDVRCSLIGGALCVPVWSLLLQQLTHAEGNIDSQALLP